MNSLLDQLAEAKESRFGCTFVETRSVVPRI